MVGGGCRDGYACQMGRLVVRTASKTRRALLTASTLIGRHWSCGVQLNEAEVPLFWLELRWSGSRWMWRCLEGEDETVGSGALLDARWRSLGRDGSIRLPRAAASLNLAHAGPPRLLLENLRTGAFMEGEDCLRIVEVRDTGVYIHDGDGAVALSDGQVFTASGEPFRVHRPVRWAATELGSLVLSDPTLTVDWNASHDQAELTVGRHSITIVGEPARLLCVYALQRQNSDGWMTNAEALAAFEKLGGYPGQDPRRMNWERSRLRHRLREAGATEVDQLFSSRRYEGHMEHRLTADWWCPEDPA